MKKCTDCAEEIQDDAKVCKHCGTRQEASAVEVVGAWGCLFLVGLVVWTMTCGLMVGPLPDEVPPPYFPDTPN